MNTRKYNTLTASPIFISRKIVEETIAALNNRASSAQDELLSLVNSTPLAKPEKHVGGLSTDHFDTSVLSSSSVENICDHLLELEVESVSPEGNTTSEASRFASLLDLWHAQSEAQLRQP